MAKLSINVIIKNIYFSDNDAIRIFTMQNNVVGFHTFHKVQYDQAIKKNVIVF